MRAWLGSIFLLLIMTAPAQALITMRVSNISDINFGSWSIGDPGLTGYMDLCIYTAGIFPVGGYAITVTGNAGYVLQSGAKQIPYTVYWNDAGAGNLSGTSGTQLTSGVKLTGLLRGNLLDSTCGSGLNARLVVKITQAAMTTALAGDYSGTITLLLTST